MIIKEIPSDFIVEEILPEGRVLESGDYLIFRLVKRERNTEDVLQDAVEILRVRRRLIGACGNKDRQAETTQYVSIKAREVNQKHVLSALSRIRGCTFTIAGYSDVPLSLGDLAGNRFTIVVRDLKPGIVAELKYPIPNYFDEQRFSGKNVAIGRCLVKCDFGRAYELIQGEPAMNPIAALRLLPQKNLTLFIHAYQSFLWNETAYMLLREKRGIEVPYSLSKFFFLKAKVEERKIPIIGFGLDDIADKALKGIISVLMEKEGITPRDFVIRQMPELTTEGGMRDLLINVMDFNAKVEDDDFHPKKKKMTLSFTLLPGCYATIVVKALFIGSL